MVEKVGSDSRFSAMFKDEEYAFDEESERARLLKPVMSAKKTKRRAEDDSDEDEEIEEGEKEEEAVLPNELFEKEKATKSDSDSMASGSDEESEEEEEKPQKKVKTKKMAIRQGVNFSSIHGGPSKEKLIEKRHLEENVSISKRVKDVKHSEVTHVKGKFSSPAAYNDPILDRPENSEIPRSRP